MKKLNLLKASVLTALLCFTITMARSQDIIVKNDKTEIKSRVIEIADVVIKYKKFELLDGPIYNINKSDVFMILYQNGTKEYMGNGAPQNTPPANPPATSQPPANNLTEETRDVKDASLSFAINSGGDTYDMEYTYFSKGNSPAKIGIGLDAYSSFSSSPSSGGVYGYLALKYSLDKAHNFSVWGNGGYNYSYSTAYSSGDTYIPSSSGSGFLWEVGANLFFSKHFGFTVYTTEGNTEWFGIVLR